MTSGRSFSSMGCWAQQTTLQVSCSLGSATGHDKTLTQTRLPSRPTSRSALTGKHSRTTSQMSMRSTTHASSLKHSGKEVRNLPTSFQSLRCSLIRQGRDPAPAEGEEQSTFVFEIVQAMLERAINNKLVNWMMASAQYPMLDNYNELKAFALYGDQIFKKQRSHKATQGASTPTMTTTTTTITDKSAPSHRAYTAPAESQGIPMDTSRTQAPDLCYNCLEKGHVASKTGPNGKKILTCPSPCKYCGKKQAESGHGGKRCPKNTTLRCGGARVRSTEVEFETHPTCAHSEHATTTPPAMESRFTSLENDMASIKDGQNIMMRRLEEFFKQRKDF